MKNKQALIVLTGPSGVGKSTLVQKLLSLYGPNIMGKTVSYTTRSPRSAEKQSQDYYFISEEHFLSLKERGFFVEWSYVYENYYATAKEELEQQWKKGKAIIKDFDLRGAKAIKKFYPDSLVVFVSPPSLEELVKRLSQRKENHSKDMQIRIQQAKKEMQQSDDFDLKIKNIKLTATTQVLKKLTDQYLMR